MIFESVLDSRGLGSGLYRTQLELHEGLVLNQALRKDFATDCVLLFLTLALMIWFFVQSLGIVLLFLPRNLYNLLALIRKKSGDSDVLRLGSEQYDVFARSLKAHLGCLILGTSIRAKEVGYAEAAMEIIVSILMVAGVLRSVCDESDISLCSSQDTDCENFSTLQGIVAKSYEFLLSDDTCHGTAWLLLYITAVFSFLSSIEKLRWVPNVFMLCAVRIVSFLFAYGILLFGYGCVMWIAFGPKYAQFATLTRSCSELFFLTCGMPMGVFDDVHPFHDAHSSGVAFMLAFYLLFFSIIFLNFFTTIILDAYSQAKDEKASDTQLEVIGDQICGSLMHSMGLYPAESPSADSGKSYENELSPCIMQL